MSDGWQRWDEDVDLKARSVMVDDFEPLANEAGRRARDWLARCVVPGTVSSATPYVLVTAGKIAGFYGLAASTVEVRTSSRVALGEDLPVQLPAYLVAQAARDRDADRGFGELMLQHALGTARALRRQAAAVALVVDPYDAQVEAVWLGLGLRASRTRLSSGRRRLWIPLQTSD